MIGARRLHVRAAVAAVVLVAFAVSTARWFVWPSLDTPHPADAIIVFGGSGGRYEKGLAMARAGLAPNLLMSLEGIDDRCRVAIPGVRVSCFLPAPLTTQGEARYLAAVTRQNGWRRVIVVVTTTQATRARIRIRRCYGGSLQVVGVALPLLKRPYAVAYEWAAMMKAFTIQRGC